MVSSQSPEKHEPARNNRPSLLRSNCLSLGEYPQCDAGGAAAMGLTKSWACVTVHRRDISKIGPAMKIKVVFLISALVLTTPLFAREKTDVLVMKNGDRMTCQVKGLDAGVLYVSFDYIDGTTSVQWSKVARLESKQLFIVKTEDGSVYTGSLNTPETPVGQPVKIEIVE